MEKQKIRVTGVPEHFNLPWLLAIEDGAFADAGLDIEWIDEPGGTGAMSKALYHKEVDVALLLTEGAITSLLSGNRAKIHSLYVESPLVWGVFSGVENELPLEKKKQGPFAISRFYSGSHLMAYVYADRENREVSKDEFNVVGGIDGARETLAKEPEHLFLWEKYITLPFVEKGEFQLVDECESPWPSFVAVVCDDVLDEKKDAIERMMDIVRDYARDLQFSGEEGAELIAHIYDMSENDATQWLQQVRFAKDVKVDVSMLGQVAEKLHELGILDHRPSVEELKSILA